MSDTMQMVRWSLDDGNRAGYVSSRFGRDRTNDALWNAIRRLGLETELRQCFRVTEPMWFGLWMDSPLVRRQCVLLHAIFSDLAASYPRQRNELTPFLDALSEAAKRERPMHVKLSAPGHVDMEWHTIFVHCPRCKAEGSVPRWEQSYSAAPIQCPICGNRYSPAATHSMERMYWTDSLACSACGTSHRIKDLSPRDIETLENLHHYETFCTELSWLRRVAEFYKRYPHMEGHVKPHFQMLLESSDARVREELSAGVPFDEISLPSTGNSIEESANWSAEDRQVIDYLRHNGFSLQPRWDFLAESIERLRPLVESQSVSCPACGAKLMSDAAPAAQINDFSAYLAGV